MQFLKLFGSSLLRPLQSSEIKRESNNHKINGSKLFSNKSSDIKLFNDARLPIRTNEMERSNLTGPANGRKRVWRLVGLANTQSKANGWRAKK